MRKDRRLVWMLGIMILFMLVLGVIAAGREMLAKNNSTAAKTAEETRDESVPTTPKRRVRPVLQPPPTSTEHTGSGCFTRADCGASEICVEEKCIPKPLPCNVASDCPKPLECTSQGCVAPSVNLLSEGSTLPRPPAEPLCFSAKCKDSGAPCLTHADCLSALKGESNVPPSDVTENAPVLPAGMGCLSREECAPGKRCLSGQCVE